jgi:hypothetical protein
MIDRKRFSKKREAALWRLVNDKITDFRILVLRGGLRGLTHEGMESVIYKELVELPDLVTAKYRAYLKEPQS